MINHMSKHLWAMTNKNHASQVHVTCFTYTYYLQPTKIRLNFVGRLTLVDARGSARTSEGKTIKASRPNKCHSDCVRFNMPQLNFHKGQVSCDNVQTNAI